MKRLVALFLVATTGCQSRGSGSSSAAPPAPVASAPHAERVRRIAGELATLGFPVDTSRIAVEVKKPADADLDLEAALVDVYPSGSDAAGNAFDHLFDPKGAEDPEAASDNSGESLTLEAYYQPRRKAMVFVEHERPASFQVDQSVAHELMHAWHDQHGGMIPFFMRRRDTWDGLAAAHCLAEGLAFAVEVSRSMSRRGLDFGALVHPRIDDPVAISKLTAYIVGLRYMHARHREGGWRAVSAALDAVPPSTEQILHPEKLGRDLPTEVSLPVLPAGLESAQLRHDTVVGEFTIMTTMMRQGYPPLYAQAVAAGWDGDRLRVWRTAAGAWLLMWRTVWDRDEDAISFALPLAKQARVGRHPRVVDAVWASDAALVEQLAAAMAAHPASYPQDPADAETTDAIKAPLIRDLVRVPFLRAGRWVHPRHRLSVPAPPGSSAPDDVDLPTLMIEAQGKPAAMVWVTSSPNVDNGDVASLEETFDRASTFTRSRRVLSRQRRTIAGVVSLVVEYEEQMDTDNTLHVLAVYIPQPGRHLGVSVNSPTTRWAGVEAAARALIEGIELLPPD